MLACVCIYVCAYNSLWQQIFALYKCFNYSLLLHSSGLTQVGSEYQCEVLMEM